MHFHATWRADHNITAGPEPEVMDMPFLVAARARAPWSARP